MSKREQLVQAQAAFIIQHRALVGPNGVALANRDLFETLDRRIENLQRLINRRTPQYNRVRQELIRRNRAKRLAAGAR